MIRLLDLEERSQEWSDHAPLVQAHAVQHDQENGGGPAAWEEVFPNDVDRKERPVAFTSQPTRIFPPHPAAEVGAQVGHERLHGIEQARLPGVLQVDVPARQLNVELGEIRRIFRSTSFASAASSLATSIRMGDSLRPCVMRSTKLNTMAITQSGVLSAERTRPRT